jgi:YVTN family beta-propeller protein
MKKHWLLCSALVLATVGCMDHDGDDSHHGGGDGDGDGDGDNGTPDGGTTLEIPEQAILIANGGSSSVQIIDPGTLKVVSTASVGTGMYPHHIGVAPDGSRALIVAPSADLSAGHGGGEHGGGHGGAATTMVYALDVASGKLEDVLEVDATAHNATFTKDGKTIVLGMMEHGMIAAYDASSLEETFTVTGLEMPLEVTPTNVGSLLVAESTAGRVAVIDLTSRQISTRFDVGAVPVAAWASGPSSYFVSVEEGMQLRHLVEGSDAVTMDEHTIDPNGMPGQAILTPDGNELWVAIEDRAVLAIFDAETHASIAEVPAGVKPHGIVFAADGARAFVTDESGGKVLVLDVAARSVTSQIDVGGKPNGIVWLSR